MSNTLIFLYNYYEFYPYLIACCIGTGIVFVFIKIQNPHILFSVKIKCIVITGCFLADSFISILLTHHLQTLGGLRHPRFILTCLKLLVSVLFGAISVPVFLILIYIISKITNSGIIKRYSFGVIIFTVTSVQLLSNLPLKLNDWCAVWYATDYSMGIGSRFFIGSLLRLFHRQYLEAKTVYHFYVCTLIVLIALMSYLLNEVIVKSSDRHRKSIVFLVLCFLAAPGYVCEMWTPEGMGRLEAYTLILSLLSVILFNAVKHQYVRYAIITILSCLSMAIYQGNLFMYYPIILMLIVWDCLSVREHRTHSRLLGLASIIITGISFVFFQFFSYTHFENAEEMVAAIKEKSDIAVGLPAVDLELFQSVKAAYIELTIQFLGEASPRERSFLTLFLLTPLVILITALYFKCREIRKQQKENILSRPYIYFILLSFAIVPQFILNTDWGRWMTAVHIVLFFGVLYLSFQKDYGMLTALDALSAFLDQHRFMSVMVIVYLAGIDKFKGRFFISETDSLMTFLTKYFL